MYSIDYIYENMKARNVKMLSVFDCLVILLSDGIRFHYYTFQCECFLFRILVHDLYRFSVIFDPQT